MNINSEEKLDFLKNLSPQDFLNIGMDQVAYIKELPLSPNEDQTFSVHAAVGTQLSVMNSYDTAIASVKINDLHPVTVQ